MVHNRRRSTFPCGCILAVAALAFMFGVCLALFRQQALAGPLRSVLGPSLPEWTRSEPVTLLLLGTDRREDEPGPSRSDTIMLAMFNPETRHVSLLSIPRDLWVTIPGHGEGRINTAFFRGQAYDVPAGGPGLAALTVEYNFGVPVDYWATVDFAGFRRIVDAIGGVTVEVPYDITDTDYPDDRNGTMTVHFPAGTQHMDGEKALQYARTRHSDSDFDRARRQQQLVKVALDKALSPQVLPKLPRLAEALASAIGTNADPQLVLALAGFVSQVEELTLDARVVDWGLAQDYVTASGAYVLLPDWPGIHALVGEMFGDRLPTAPPLANTGVRVENATSLPGLAAHTAAFLQSQGATITAAVDRQGSNLSKSQLYIYAPAPVAELYLRSIYRLGQDQLHPAEGGPPQTHMTLVLGWDVLSGG